MESSISSDQKECQVSQILTSAENEFCSLLAMEDLDEHVMRDRTIVHQFEEALAIAIEAAYSNPISAPEAHLFLQRVLYRINRLKLFWYDDLAFYNNERSEYLRKIRNRIESAWQAWELSQLQLEEIDPKQVCQLLLERAAEDVAPHVSAEGLYFQNHVGVAGYRKLLQISSLDGLVEASQLSRTLGGVGNDIHSMMTRLLVEEYGGGRLNRKHSSFFTLMLHELRMNSRPEAYFDVVPWEVLATINHSFLLSERKRFYLRYVGGLLYTEVSVPAAFNNYRLAAERLGMSSKARAYWELHIKEDERHGRWMLNDVAIPLAQRYPAEAAEIVLGYDQQKFMSARAGRATALAAKDADYEDAIQTIGAISTPMLANIGFASNGL
jgi:hypothetical protein